MEEFLSGDNTQSWTQSKNGQQGHFHVSVHSEVTCWASDMCQLVSIQCTEDTARFLVGLGFMGQDRYLANNRNNICDHH